MLREDTELARSLIRDDDNPFALAYGASALTAGVWEHQCQRMGLDPSQAWADSLLAMKRKGSS